MNIVDKIIAYVMEAVGNFDISFDACGSDLIFAILAAAIMFHTPVLAVVSLIIFFLMSIIAIGIAVWAIGTIGESDFTKKYVENTFMKPQLAKDRKAVTIIICVTYLFLLIGQAYFLLFLVAIWEGLVFAVRKRYKTLFGKFSPNNKTVS